MEKFIAELKRRLKGTNEDCGIQGAVFHRLIGPDGTLKQEGMIHNLVTSVGDRWLSHYVANSVVGNPSSMWAELGVNTTAPLKADTGLGTLLAASSKVVENSYPVRVDSHSGAGEWTLWRYSWAAGVATCGSIGEVGLRTQTGSFVAHAQVAPNVNKAAGDTLQIDWGWKFLGA